MNAAVDPLLDSLFADLPAKPAAATPASGGQAIAKTHYTHEAMIDLIIANPGISQNEIAAHFGYTPSWISRVFASEAFQAKYAERVEKLVDPLVAKTMKERFDALVLRSLDILEQKLNLPAQAVSDQLVLRTLELSSRAAGYGAKDTGASPGATVNIDIHLDQMAQRMTGLLRKQRGVVIDQTPAESPSKPCSTPSTQVSSPGTSQEPSSGD